MKYWLNVQKENCEEGKPPEYEWKEVSEAKYFEAINKDLGGRILINPTHNFELLKAFRLQIFENAKVRFIEERKSKGLETGDLELNAFYFAWLKHELEVIKTWLSDKHPNGKPKQRPSTSRQMEILKYESFINAEMEQCFQDSKPTKPNSDVRARGFCILLLKKAGKLQAYTGKKELIKIVERLFPGKSGKTVYNMIQTGKDKLTLEHKEKYPLDYDFGLNWFNEMKDQ